MSKKDIDRSNTYIFRDGHRIPHHVWDRQRRKEEEAVEARRLAKVGLVRTEPSIVTPEEIMKGRRPIE